MLRLGVVAAVLVSLGLLVGAFAQAARTPAQKQTIEHTCGLTDRQFLANYRLQLTEVGVYGDDYLNRTAGADAVIEASEEAADVVRSSAPFDPSLQAVKKYAPAMFLQYADAVRARKNGHSAAREMYLAYSIAARVDEVLRDARPGLEAAGCDVSGVLE